MSFNPGAPDSRANARAINESLLAAIVASTEDAIISKTLDGVVTSWNGGAEKIFGYTAAEMIGQPITRLFPVDRFGEESSILDRLRRGETVKHFDTVRIRKDGSLIDVSVTISPIRDASGNILGASKIARDITSRKKVEHDRDELNARFAKLSSMVPGVIYQFKMRADGTSCFPYSSEAIREIYRVSPEQVMDDASAVFAVLHPEDRDSVAASIKQSAETLQPWQMEYRVRFPDGSIHWLRGESTPERTADGGTIWHGFISDITESRRLETKLVESAKLESLGVLAGGIAHDFNNLLTGILGNASLARQELPPASLGQPMLDQIETAARRAADLCKQMLAYSGKGRFVVQRLDLNKLVEDTTHLLQISIAKNCVLRFNLAANLPAIKADATQLRQVIMNLVINGSEAIGNRSGVLALTTGVARVDSEYLKGFRPDASPVPGDYVFIEVSDNGCGMDSATLAKIFDPFFTTKFTGRGLGLAAVLGIVRGHKGGLKVYSEPGKGTTFKLFFPVAGGKPQDSFSPFQDAAPFQGSGTVLVVDDEETVRTVAARMLERLGFSVVMANDGREGMERFRTDPTRFTLVLLDLTMPHLDGEETFRQMRMLNPTVRVILTSGFNQQEAINRFTGKGLAGFIQKPFELASLIQVIRSVLPHN
ncbi:PAS domain-containing hybrid sensor histidine kinase/response regulator [Oleiharenicola lentus]|jgi:PAS domain S-box-containing protein|uniref:histidine kinase n=1 Tax=Oleiharenicola lentus TaxID=2508720 RepID=A0A4V1M6E5_9BACT|nr:PAS domain-containing hybrid sensor histidine kinase/response regulator [Oleiharenicola lentus]RXK55119.1 PAS domain-containing hybrid sensor histidine kinase/response regulator [Oleiharenicola lentus]